MDVYRYIYILYIGVVILEHRVLGAYVLLYTICHTMYVYEQPAKREAPPKSDAYT